jgi:hypothetical protein
MIRGCGLNEDIMVKYRGWFERKASAVVRGYATKILRDKLDVGQGSSRESNLNILDGCTHQVEAS